MFRKAIAMPIAAQALPGHSNAIQVSDYHAVNKNSVKPPFCDSLKTALFGMGCFWGAERKFWNAEGVYATSVGYAAGFTQNATYEEVCSGMTAHNEVVRVIFDNNKTNYEALLSLFWQSHNPTQGFQQGNDLGTQYRSGIYFYDDAQQQAALASKQQYQQKLTAGGHDAITTEIIAAPEFYFAEDYHQQYLHKNPNGYCGLGGTGVDY